MIRSPRRMVVRSPATTVKPPSLSSTRRSADAVWRWAGAVSPGRTSCTPAYIVPATRDWPRNAGFSSTRTRRSASSALSSAPASSRSGRTVA